MTRKRTLALTGVLLTSVALISGCSQDIPAINCVSPDFDCYIKQAVTNINVVKQNIGYWSTINLICQVSVIFLGIVATLMIALQGDANKRWTRPIGIIATTLVTGVSSAIANFHVPENVDKLIDIAGDMATATTAFEEKAELLKAGRTKTDVDEAYKTNARFREATNSLMSNFSERHNKIKMDLWRIKGTAARLNPAPLGPAPGKQPNKTP